ncbi:MAG: hypothetical protein EU544_03415 [Promethearchaeota archaeon]|nr:MAG: hypothetical protein EU544_03415 [Candidatus Lokiarchaeota archaeon]
MALEEVQEVKVICPVCKTSHSIELSRSVIRNSAQLTTVSVPKDFMCDHHFQVFIDKNFKVRGYQKVDLELQQTSASEATQKGKKFAPQNEKDLFNNLFLEGNFVSYNPKFITADKLVKKEKKKKKNPASFPPVNESKSKKSMSLEEIYEEFWEFIDEDNPEFQEFIKKDKKRQALKEISII